MNRFYVLTLTCCFLFKTTLAQQPAKLIHFKNGNIDRSRNLLNKKITSQAFYNARYNKKYFILIQFDKLPGITERNELSSRGIALFDYLPDNAFLVELRDSSVLQELRSYHARGIYSLPGEFKISKRLLQHI